MYTESIDRCVCQVRTDNIYLIDFSHLFSGDKEQIYYPFYMFPWQPQAFCSSKIFYIFKTKWNTNVMVFVVEGVIPCWIFVILFYNFWEADGFKLPWKQTGVTLFKGYKFATKLIFYVILEQSRFSKQKR